MSWQGELQRMEERDARDAIALGKALDDMGIGHKPLHRGGLHSKYSILPKPSVDYILGFNAEAQKITVFKNCKPHYSMIFMGAVDLVLPVEERLIQFNELVNAEPICNDMCEAEEDEDEADDE